MSTVEKLKRTYQQHQQNEQPFRTFEDLEVYKKARHLPKSEIDLKEQAKELQRLISGYVRYLRARKFGSSLRVNEAAEEEQSRTELDFLFNNSTI